MRWWGRRTAAGGQRSGGWPRFAFASAFVLPFVESFLCRSILGTAAASLLCCLLLSLPAGLGRSRTAKHYLDLFSPKTKVSIGICDGDRPGLEGKGSQSSLAAALARATFQESRFSLNFVRMPRSGVAEGINVDILLCLGWYYNNTLKKSQQDAYQVTAKLAKEGWTNGGRVISTGRVGVHAKPVPFLVAFSFEPWDTPNVGPYNVMLMVPCGCAKKR